MSMSLLYLSYIGLIIGSQKISIALTQLFANFIELHFSALSKENCTLIRVILFVFAKYSRLSAPPSRKARRSHLYTDLSDKC